MDAATLREFEAALDTFGRYCNPAKWRDAADQLACLTSDTQQLIIDEAARCMRVAGQERPMSLVHANNCKAQRLYLQPEVLGAARVYGFREQRIFELLSAMDREVETTVIDRARRLLDQQPFLPAEHGVVSRSVMVGDVQDLLPSGKYWTAWAKGNVTDLEVLADEHVRGALERAAERLGMDLEAGEGDPSVLYCTETFG